MYSSGFNKGALKKPYNAPLFNRPQLYLTKTRAILVETSSSNHDEWCEMLEKETENNCTCWNYKLRVPGFEGR